MNKHSALAHRRLLNAIRKNASDEKIAKEARSFFEHVSPYTEVFVKHVDCVDLYLYRLTVSTSHRPDDTQSFLVNTRDESIEIDGVSVCEAELAARFGLPPSYWDGFVSVLGGAFARKKDVIGMIEIAKFKEMELDDREKRIEEREKEIDFRFATKEASRNQRVSEALRRSSLENGGYPSVPNPVTMVANLDRNQVPECPGIYFVWHAGVEYVGQSVSLRQRVCNKSHGSIFDSDYISWVFLPKEELDFAEAYYIGTLRPSRNFGKNAKWNSVIAR